MNNKLYVGNLPWSMTSDSLKELFAKYGDIDEVVVITDRMTGKSKGFGFVTFKTDESASSAVEQMHEYEIDGRKIVVNVARPKREDGGRNR